MKKILALLAVPVTLIGITCTSLGAKAEHTGSSSTGAKGAKIYCFMRTTGNDHEVSWNAAYAVIKRQASSIFKTSPKHAAVMITESVVEHPNDYENCGSYLGDLYGGQAIDQPEESVESKSAISDDTKSAIKDRYNY